MSNAFYRVNVGDTAMPSDVNQTIDALAGRADVGTITLAPQVDNPSTAIGVATAAAGTSLGVGAYLYAYTWVTGIVKDNAELVISGETLPSPLKSVTTTSNNQDVDLSSIPLPSVDSTVIAKRIYRTAVGGAQLKLVTTLTSSVTSYTDTLPDASLGANAPTTNTTGTHIAFTPQGDLTATTYDGALVELQATIERERQRSLSLMGEQNMRIFGLQAQVLAAREGLSGWQGEGFYNAASQVEGTPANVRINRAALEASGYAEGIYGSGFSNSGWTAPSGLRATASPATLAMSVEWSKSGRYVALALTASPWLAVYRVDGDNNTLTACTIGTNPTGTNGFGGVDSRLSWGRATDGTEYVAGVAVNGTSPKFEVWKVTADTTLTRVSSIDVTGVVDGVLAWHPSGDWLIGHFSAGVIPITRSGDTFTVGSAVSTGTTVRDAVFTSDGATLWIAGTLASNYIRSASVSGTTITMQAVPSNQPPRAAYGVSVSNDGTLLVAALTSSSVTDVYRVWPISGYNLGAPVTLNTSAATSSPSGLYGNFVAFSGPGDNDRFIAGVSTAASYYELDLFEVTSRSPLTVSLVPNVRSTLGIGAAEANAGTDWGDPCAVNFSPDGTLLALVYVCGANRALRTIKGAAVGSNVASATIPLNAVTLPQTCDHVYVLDSFTQTSGTGVHRKYEVSLNGGTAWETINESDIGTFKALGHSGTSLKVRAVLYHDLGDSSQARLSWFIAFAGTV